MSTELEDQRHKCEVRMLISARREPSRGEEWVRCYLRDSKVAGRRAALIRDIKDQLDKGSTGEEGVWI